MTDTPIIRDGKLVTAPIPASKLDRLTMSQKDDLQEIIIKSDAGKLTGADLRTVLALRKAVS